MNSGWEKYFEPSYYDLQEVNEPIKELIFFGVICSIISFCTIQFITENVKTADGLIGFLSTKPEISRKIEIIEAQNTVLESEILILNHKFASIIDNKAQNFLGKFENLLTLNEEHGEGVTVTLKDSAKPLTFEENPNLMIVHNLDLLAIVNELWASGAKAVSVNDQRITSTSEFNCIGPIILVNNSRILPPFIIRAVGNSDKLARAVSEGYIKKYNLEKYGITFSIDKSDNVTIPASSQTLITDLKGS